MCFVTLAGDTGARSTPCYTSAGGAEPLGVLQSWGAVGTGAAPGPCFCMLQLWLFVEAFPPAGLEKEEPCPLIACCSVPGSSSTPRSAEEPGDI